MTLDRLNSLPDQDAATFFLTCCGSKRWAQEMTNRRPFGSVEDLQNAADEVWFSLSEEDWKEGFSAHPKIGDRKGLKTSKTLSGRRPVGKFQSTPELASKEQSGVIGASEQTLKALADGNAAYEAKFGYIFIVCATSKTADEMLFALNERLMNSPSTEIRIAAEEQAKITRLRVKKLLE
jgi:2-oxo-4-hydroxy-4-carboxy-5-ureidoimidazoline decarboxylase